MPLHSALAKLPARLLSWLRFLPRSWISVYILCDISNWRNIMQIHWPLYGTGVMLKEHSVIYISNWRNIM